MDEDPIARAAYDRLADAYAAGVDTKAHHAFYERPVTLSLLPPVAGRKVLDAGCGPGAYADWLADHGADVVAVDVSPRMVEHAVARLRGRARILEADLGRPLDFLETSSFDVVVSALALDHVRDWDAVLREFFRVLRAPGHVVFSAEHPSAVFYDHHRSGNYFDVERVEVSFHWPSHAIRERVPKYRRPFAAMLDPVFRAGFVVQRIVEPRPQPEFAREDPAIYAKLAREPGFICVRALKPPPDAGRLLGGA